MFNFKLFKRCAIAVLSLLVAIPAVSFADLADNDPYLPDQGKIELAAAYHREAGGETLLVMHDGRIIYEEYADGWSADKPHLLASGSKSFVGLTAIAAVQDGFIRLDDPVSTSLTEWGSDPEKNGITYRQLLTFTSGITSSEPGKAIKEETPAWSEVIKKPMKYKPGEKFEYGAYHLYAFGEALQRILLERTGETFESYLKRRILDPLGVTVEWRMRCEDGNPQLGGGAYMSAKDWAAVGEFVRNKGMVNGKSVMDAALIEELFKGTKANPAYGLTWWLKEPISGELDVETGHGGSLANSPWAPEDLAMAAGLGEQRLYVIPSLELVVVRQGPVSKARTYRDTAFLSRLLRGVPDESENDVQNPNKPGNRPSGLSSTMLFEINNPYAIVRGKKVPINGNLSVKPFRINGKLMIPVRFLSEQYGAKVVWRSGTWDVLVTIGDTIASIPIGEATVMINGRQVLSDVPASLINGTLFLPLELLAEDILGKHSLVEGPYIQTSELPIKRIPQAVIDLLEKP